MVILGDLGRLWGIKVSKISKVMLVVPASPLAYTYCKYITYGGHVKGDAGGQSVAFDNYLQ
jgi:hypothetical protein